MRFDFQTYLPQLYDGEPFGPAELTALEDEVGVERFVVVPEAAVQPDNSGLAQRLKDQPRAVGCAAVNPALGDGAVAEFERAVGELGFRGLRLFPADHGYPVDGELVRPLMEKARDLGVPVTVDGCREHCAPLQIARMAGWFPEVPVIVDVGFRPSAPPASLGQALPAEGRIAETALETPNIYLGLTAMAAVELYLIKRLLTVVGAERLIFGSNAPYGIPAIAVEGFRLAQLGDSVEEGVLGETLRQLYRLS